MLSYHALEAIISNHVSNTLNENREEVRLCFRIKGFCIIYKLCIHSLSTHVGRIC